MVAPLGRGGGLAPPLGRGGGLVAPLERGGGLAGLPVVEAATRADAFVADLLPFFSCILGSLKACLILTLLVEEGGLASEHSKAAST